MEGHGRSGKVLKVMESLESIILTLDINNVRKVMVGGWWKKLVMST